MEDEGEREASLLPRLLKGVAIIAGFIALSALFAVLLRPLAAEHGGEATVALPPPIKAAARQESAPVRQEVALPPAAPPSPPSVAGPKVAILVTEIGDDLTLGERAVTKLPPAFGLAFLPGRPLAKPLAARARADGHEVWIGLPMQPRGWPKVSPGPNTLLVGDTAETNAKRVEWALSQVDRPVGAYTMMGSAFTADAAAMVPVAAAMKQRGVVLLDARSTGSTVAAKTMRDAGGRALSNNLFVDATPGRAAINAALDQLARQAKSRGSAVGIARALPGTLDALPIWAEGLKERGVTLVPPSSLAQ